MGQFYHSCAQDTPAVALSEANVLCLHTVATVLVLLAVVSPDHPALGTPRPSLLQTVVNRIGLAWYTLTCPQSVHLPDPRTRG